MKPTENFKLSKTSKRMIATITNADLRNAYKANMIHAQLCSEVKIESKKEKQ